MRAKPEILALGVLAALHLLAVLTHGYSHVMAEVWNTPGQSAFILLVVVLAPLAAVGVAWRSSTGTGAGLFALAMGAALVFGYLYHFVLDSPDHHAHVTGPHAPLFFHSALHLALLEIAGLALGAYLWLRHRREG